MRVENEAEGKKDVEGASLKAKEGMAAFKRGKYEESVAAFTQAIAMDRSDYRYYLNRGYCLGKLER